MIRTYSFRGQKNGWFFSLSESEVPNSIELVITQPDGNAASILLSKTDWEEARKIGDYSAYGNKFDWVSEKEEPATPPDSFSL
jgi:hypothetical protein